MATNVWGLMQPGLAPRGLCRRKLVNFILKTIYGGTGIKASRSLGSDPRVAQQPVLAVVLFLLAQCPPNRNNFQCSMLAFSFRAQA
jgi:hypothetical protein